MMDYMWVWVAIAFVCGFLAKQIKLPPLVGFLAAGFVLHSFGVQPDSSLETLSELGISLLLFTIGLKLNLNSLFKPVVLFGTTSHMLAIVGLTVMNSAILGYLGLKFFTDLDWTQAALVGFAVSFSSTVCAVKILEERGEMKARHGQIAIGILVIQDIIAVGFLTLATGKVPSIWALGLLLLPLIRPLLSRLMNLSGHGELLPLTGIFLALTGGELFELVGLKAHLGALVFGALLSSQQKASELSKSLLGFKDIFLIGFFLSIGFTALPTIDMLGVALIMSLALPFKTAMFFFLLAGLKLRGRTAFLSSLSLANYSEFGLIVCSIAVTQGILDKEWLVIMALAIVISFVFASIVNVAAHSLYYRWRTHIKRFELKTRLPEDQFSEIGDASILVIGMGRVGTGAYDAFRRDHEGNICGIDVENERIAEHCEQGRKAIVADAEDPEFWEQTNLDQVSLIMLAMPNHQDLLEAAKQIKLNGFKGKMAGVARYEDEKQSLIDAGVDVAFNYYDGAGAGLAESSWHLLEE